MAFVVLSWTTKNHTNKYPTNIIQQDTIITNDTTDFIYMESRENLITCVDTYIKNVAPTSNIDSEYFVDMCDLYNVDIRLALAQAHLESHFGTKGTASKTNSMFNIGAYDGHSANKQIKNGFGFPDPNCSIEPYLKTLTTNYLVDGVTEKDLLNNFVNKHGWRYASSKEYEIKLTRLWNNMDDISIALEEYEIDRFLNNV